MGLLRIGILIAALVVAGVVSLLVEEVLDTKLKVEPNFLNDKWPHSAQILETYGNGWVCIELKDQKFVYIEHSNREALTAVVECS